MECKRESRSENCSCSYAPCPRKGICCDCVSYHVKNRELPGCFFTSESEKTYDRSFEHFARLVAAKKV